MCANNCECLAKAFSKACEVLLAADWRGLEAEIARTGEEDPLAMVDDPDMAAVIAAKLALRRSEEAHMFRDLDDLERETAAALFKMEADLSATSADETTRLAAITTVAHQILAIAGKLTADGSGGHDARLGRLFLLAKFCDLAKPFARERSWQT